MYSSMMLEVQLLVYPIGFVQILWAFLRYCLKEQDVYTSFPWNLTTINEKWNTEKEETQRHSLSKIICNLHINISNKRASSLTSGMHNVSYYSTTLWRPVTYVRRQRTVVYLANLLPLSNETKGIGYIQISVYTVIQLLVDIVRNINKKCSVFWVARNIYVVELDSRRVRRSVLKKTHSKNRTNLSLLSFVRKLFHCWKCKMVFKDVVLKKISLKITFYIY